MPSDGSCVDPLSARGAGGVQRGARTECRTGRRQASAHREHRRLIAERVQHVNRIKGLCATQGIYDYSPLRKDRLARLDGLRTGDGRALPTRLKAEIVRELERLELVIEMIATVEAERDAILTNPASTHVMLARSKCLPSSERSA